MKMTLIEFLKEVDCVEIIITSYTEAEALEEVKQNGHALKYVHNQTKEICLAAVKQNGHALQYVDKSIFDAEPSTNSHTITLNGLTYVLQG